MDNENELLDSEIETNDEESFEDEEVQEPEDSEESPSLDADELAIKNKQLYARLKKEEEKRKELETKLESAPQDKPINETSSVSDERIERLELKTEGYSGEEIDEIMTLGGKKALDNEIIKAGIEAARRKKKSEAATPAEGNSSPVFRKYTQKDLQDMPLEEMEKLLRR